MTSRDDQIAELWANEVVAAQMEGRKPRQRTVAESSGFSASDVNKTINGRLRAAKPGRTPSIGPRNKQYLEVLVQSGLFGYDRSYCKAYSHITGELVSRRTMSNTLSSGLSSKTKRIVREPASLDKFTDKNFNKLVEFTQGLWGVDRSRLRFYDQTGISSTELLPEKRRVMVGQPLPDPPPLPSSNTHYSVFGITTLHLDIVPVYYRFFPCARRLTQNSAHHATFFKMAWQDGVLRHGDVVIEDNWAAHGGHVGQLLKQELRDQGIVTHPIPPRWSNLNSSEHEWRRMKSYGRLLIDSDPSISICDASVVWAAKTALQTITHKDIMDDMKFDGYAIEPETEALVNMYSKPSGIKYNRKDYF